MTKVACFLILLSLVFGQIKSENVFRFANVFGSHMVLQQAPKRASVWGYGEVGQEVVVMFNGEVYRTFITAQGIWTVMLTASVFGGPYRIEAHSRVKGAITTIILDDVMFGDVWICSGQSNMEFTLDMSDNGAKAINESARYRDIRIFTVEHDCANTRPEMELRKVPRLPWSLPSPETVGGPKYTYFSAVCWYYAVQLYEELGYPIGLVSSSWVGTAIEVWSSPDALATCRLDKTAKIVDTRKFEPNELHMNAPLLPSCLWNAMIFPFLKMTIYGSIWYQGETNAIFHNLYPLPYNCTFPAMIDDWRAKWYASTQRNTDPMFPFGFVQISAIGNNPKQQFFNFAPLRWDQTAHYGYVPNDRQKRVFMAVAMDLGNPKSPYGSIHPTDKSDVGYRLALAGLDVGYGRKRYYSGPLVDTIKKQTELPLALEVTFKSLNDEIEVRSEVGFEVLCENGIDSSEWVDAPLLNRGPSSVVIRSPDCVVVKVRYAWSDYPCPKLECAIYSGGLPSPPFIMDGPFEGAESSLFEKLFDVHV